MAVFNWTIPATLAPKVTDDTADAVKEYLTAGGNATTKVDIKGDPFRFVIDAASDPTAALNAYAGQPSAKRDQLEKAKAFCLDYAQKVRTNQTVTAADTQKATAFHIFVDVNGGFDT